MPEFRKGHAAIEEAAKKSSGSFTPFAPSIGWKNDMEEKYILVLSPIAETHVVDLHEFIEVGTGSKANGDIYTKFESFISRKDPGIGESEDKIEDLGRTPRRRSLGVAVELEPEFGEVRGRKKPVGFKVKTQKFSRKTDDGKVEVEGPVIGMLVQAQKNFFGYLQSYDRTTGPVHETPFKVVRRGTDNDTTYDFKDYEDMEVDFSGLFDNIENIGYLADEADDIQAAIEAADDDWAAAVEVGMAMYEKRFDELTSKERYDEIMGPIDSLPAPRFGGGTVKKSETNGDGGTKTRTARPARKSQRRKSSDDSTNDDDGRRAEFDKLRDVVEQN